MLMTAFHAASFTDARKNLKALLDAAPDGRAATVRRDRDYLALVDAARLRHVLGSVVPAPSAVPRTAEPMTRDEAIARLNAYWRKPPGPPR
jgi:hypothetical protein